MISTTLTLEELARRAAVDYDASLNATDAVKMTEHRSDCGHWLHVARSLYFQSRGDWAQWIIRETSITRLEAKACLSAYNSLMGTAPTTARNKARKLFYLMGQAGQEGGESEELLQEIQQEQIERYDKRRE